jgi:hypothetical protein
VIPADPSIPVPSRHCHSASPCNAGLYLSNENLAPKPALLKSLPVPVVHLRAPRQSRYGVACYIVHATPTRLCRSLASQSLTCRVHITGRASPPRVLRNTGGRGRSGLTISFHPLCGVSTCCRNRTSFTVRRIVRHSKHCRTRRAALPPAASLTATEACPLTRGHGRFSCQTNQQQPFCYRHQSGQASTSDTRVLTATCQAWPDWPW